MKTKWLVNGVTYNTIAEAGEAYGVHYNSIRNWCNGVYKLPSRVWQAERIYGGGRRRRPALRNGLSTHPLYSVWWNIRARCFDPTDLNYHNYGGRGITMCKEWEDDFMLFYDYCITNGWVEGLEVDRRDNNGNYEPDNIQFMTRQQNMCNLRKSRIWIIEGREYASCRLAAAGENVGSGKIQQWCHGYTTATGKYRPPKQNCSSRPTYEP